MAFLFTSQNRSRALANPRDQHAWQLANELTWRVWVATAGPAEGGDTAALRERARGAARLIAASVAKGFEREDRGHRLRFFAVALSASDDTRAHLAQAVESGDLGAREFELVLDVLRRTSVAIRRLMAVEREALAEEVGSTRAEDGHESRGGESQAYPAVSPVLRPT